MAASIKMSHTPDYTMAQAIFDLEEKLERHAATRENLLDRYQAGEVEAGPMRQALTNLETEIHELYERRRRLLPSLKAEQRRAQAAWN